MSEKEFQSQIVQLARLQGWLVYHTFDSRRSEPGFPDLVLAHEEGGVLFREIKTDTGKTTGAQELWLQVLLQLQEPQVQQQMFLQLRELLRQLLPLL